MVGAEQLDIALEPQAREVPPAEVATTVGDSMDRLRADIQQHGVRAPRYVARAKILGWVEEPYIRTYASVRRWLGLPQFAPLQPSPPIQPEGPRKRRVYGPTRTRDPTD